MKSYSEKLKDPRWQKKRLEILSRDSFACKYCKCETRELHIHHTAYSGEPWEQENEKLETVCFLCHQIIEDYKKDNLPIYGSVIIYGKNEDNARVYCGSEITLYQVHENRVYFLVTIEHSQWAIINKEFNKMVKNG